MNIKTVILILCLFVGLIATAPVQVETAVGDAVLRMS